MTIEPGELFVVAQGPEYHSQNMLASPFGDVMIASEAPVRHDRSWNKYIFRAIEVCAT